MHRLPELLSALLARATRQVSQRKPGALWASARLTWCRLRHTLAWLVWLCAGAALAFPLIATAAANRTAAAQQAAHGAQVAQRHSITIPECATVSPVLRALDDEYFDAFSISAAAVHQAAPGELPVLPEAARGWRGTAELVECFGRAASLNQQRDEYLIESARVEMPGVGQLRMVLRLQHWSRTTQGYVDARTVRPVRESPLVRLDVQLPVLTRSNREVLQGGTQVWHWTERGRGAGVNVLGERVRQFRESAYWLRLEDEAVHLTRHYYVNGRFAAAQRIRLIKQ